MSTTLQRQRHCVHMHYTCVVGAQQAHLLLYPYKYVGNSRWWEISQQVLFGARDVAWQSMYITPTLQSFPFVSRFTSRCYYLQRPYWHSRRMPCLRRLGRLPHFCCSVECVKYLRGHFLKRKIFLYSFLPSILPHFEPLYQIHKRKMKTFMTLTILCHSRVGEI